MFYLRDNGGPATTITGTSVVADGDWHHIIAVRDGNANQNELYVDGVKEAHASFSYVHTFKADNPLVVTIGYLKDPTGEMHFIGAIDEVTIFNRAIAPTEVSTFYNEGIPSAHNLGSNHFPYFTTTPSTSVNEDVSYSYTATVTDEDVADALAISVIYKPSWLNFSWTPGQKTCVLSGIPSNYNVGEDDVVLRVSDDLMTRDQIFRINVINVNDPPTKASVPVTTVNEGTPYSYVLTVSDIDPEEVITMTRVVFPAWMTFTYTPGSKTATLTGTPDDPNVGPNPIDISITDGDVTIHESYTLTVNQVNDAPAITGQNTITGNEDQNITLLASHLTIADPDNQASELTITVQAGTNYTFIGNVVTPANNFTGPLSVNVIASDLALNSAPYAAIVNVSAINDAPVITGHSTLSVNKNGSLTIQKSDLTIIDIDNLSSEITLTVQAGANYTFINNTITPAANFTGQLNVNVVASDLALTSGVHVVPVTVVSVGTQSPVITGQSALSFNEDENLTIVKSNLTITDGDSPDSEIRITVQDGSNYTHIGNSIIPSADFTGALSVNVIASDLTSNGQVYQVVITVNPVNDKPIVTTSPILTVAAGSLYTYVFNASDVDNTTLTKSAVIIPDWMDFSASTGLLAGNPTSEHIGQHLITLRVSDGTENVDLSFTITVTSATAIGEIKNQELILYPSPASDVLNVRFDNLSEETIIEIVSLTGTVIESKVVPANTDVADIDVQHMNTGIYFCHVKNSKMDMVKRFIVAR
jgi:hypothetical protein